MSVVQVKFFFTISWGKKANHSNAIKQMESTVSSYLSVTGNILLTELPILNYG